MCSISFEVWDQIIVLIVYFVFFPFLLSPLFPFSSYSVTYGCFEKGWKVDAFLKVSCFPWNSSSEIVILTVDKRWARILVRFLLR
jgi:hypothetical protein